MVRKYGVGGGFNMVGSLADAFKYSKDGSQDTSAGFISGAAQGASAGSILGPAGSIIGGAIGGIKGLASAKKANKALELQKRATRDFEAEMDISRSKSYLATYPVDGVQTSSYYAMGGKMGYGGYKADGGKLLSLTGKVQLASGNSHNQGGIKLSRKTDDKPFAEIEDKEVLKDGELVYSNQIGENGRSYAELARATATSPNYQRQEAAKAKAQIRTKYGGIYTSTAKRVQSNKDDMDRIFDRQEAGKESVPKAALGLDFKDLGKGLNKIAPYVDNIGNAIITSKTPEIPRPRLSNAPRLNTKFDVNDQLAAIGTRGNARDTSIARNSSNATTTRANLIGGASEDIRSTNSLLANKRNQELQLENNQVLADHEQATVNRAALDKFDTMNMMRTDDIQQRVSTNLADASTNAMQVNREKNLAIRDTQELALIAAKYKESGVLDRSGYSKLMQFIQEGNTLEEAQSLLEQLKNGSTPNAASKSKLSRINYRNLNRKKLNDTSTIYDDVFASDRYARTA